MPFWAIALLIAVVVEVIAYAIIPKPAAPKPPAVQDEQTPTADASKPIPVIFGELTVNGTNVLWVGNKSQNTYDVTS
jgi:hypothetical protein